MLVEIECPGVDQWPGLHQQQANCESKPPTAGPSGHHDWQHASVANPNRTYLVSVVADQLRRLWANVILSMLLDILILAMPVKQRFSTPGSCCLLQASLGHEEESQ